MTVNPEYLSPCGLYCGVCAIHIAHRSGNEKFKARLANLYKGGVPGKGTLPNSESLSAQDIQCDGCLSGCLFMHCRHCDIRNCCQTKGIAGCHQCNDFPCEHIDNFPMTVGKKVILRSVPYRREHGDEQWVADEKARYHCPTCGNQVFRGAMRCNRCKAALQLD
jgi:hypothetical protein